MRQITAIACVNESWAIGKNNKLLCHIKEDMEYFKSNTIGNTVIYGNSTLKSFPKAYPLSGRYNIVITHDIKNIPQSTIDYCDNVIYLTDKESICIKGTNIIPLDTDQQSKFLYVATSIETAIKIGFLLDKDIFICGGESIYKQAIDYCDEAYLTITDYEALADSYFPNLDERKDWYCYTDYAFNATANGIMYKFANYKNLNKKSVFDIEK